MEQALDILSWVFLVGGSFFLLVGAFGVLRFPDVYTRGHAAGITDTLAALLILVGMMFQSGFSLITAKLLMILLFLLFTSPAASHALGNAAWSSGLKPKLEEDSPIKDNTDTRNPDKEDT